MSAVGSAPANTAVEPASSLAPSTSAVRKGSGDKLEMGTGVSVEIVQQVRQVMAPELDAKVADALESVWAQGQQDVQQFLSDSRIRNEELINTMAEFREREDALEADNVALRQVLTNLLGQLAQWGSGGAGAPFPTFPTDIGPTQGVAKARRSSSKSEGPQQDGISSTASGSTGSVSGSPHLSCEAWPALGCQLGGMPAAPASESGGSSTEGQGWDVKVPKFPEVPPFPFPHVPQAPSTPSPTLSLSEALGLDAPPASWPACDAQPSLPPGLGGLTFSPEAAVFTPFSAEYGGAEVFPPYTFDYPAEADGECPADGFIFSITLRKAEGCSFGLATSAMSHQDGLHIDAVLPGGAAEAWNRQCGSSGAAEKVLLPGDAIVSINGFSGSPEDMKMACEKEQLLRLMVVRSDGPRSAPPMHVAVVSATPKMRAEASEFVPISPQKLSPEASEFVPFSPEAAAFVPMGLTDFDDSYDDTIGLPAC